MFVASTGQVSAPHPDADGYAHIPKVERHEFQTALEALVALERLGKWDDVYDRFYLNETGLTKKEFVDKRRKLEVAFAPMQISYVPPKEGWLVSGCAVFSPPSPLLKGKSGGVISDFAAKRTATGWRFEAPPAITLFEDSSGSMRSCAVGVSRQP